MLLFLPPHTKGIPRRKIPIEKIYLFKNNLLFSSQGKKKGDREGRGWEGKKEKRLNFQPGLVTALYISAIAGKKTPNRKRKQKSLSIKF